MAASGMTDLLEKKMNVKTLLAGMLALPLIGACTHAPASAPQKNAPVQPEERVMCTQDARQCPDGSWVGRSGPSCEFKCPAGR